MRGERVGVLVLAFLQPTLLRLISSPGMLPGASFFVASRVRSSSLSMAVITGDLSREGEEGGGDAGYRRK